MFVSAGRCKRRLITPTKLALFTVTTPSALILAVFFPLAGIGPSCAGPSWSSDAALA